MESKSECSERKGTPEEYWFGNNHLVDFPYSFSLCREISGRVYPYWSAELRATISFGDHTGVFHKGKVRYCTVVPFDDESAEEVLGVLLRGASSDQPALL